MSGADAEQNEDRAAQAEALDARRVLNLAGGVNFRDLGGYKTADGRSVRWGRLYRSGNMAGLTEPDHAVLAGLQIAGVHDLRTNSEREREPNRWAQMAGIAYWSRDYESELGVLTKMLFADIPDPEAARWALLKDYRRIPFDHAPAYRALLERLRDGELPMVFNCSAGKDRAGTAAALVLSLLGVPRETVVQDYRLTDKVLSGQAEAMKRVASAYGRISAEIWDILIGTDDSYIQNAFDAIDERHGSLEGYFKDELGIDAAAVEVIRDRLLE